MKSEKKGEGLVYSSAFGRMCPQCNQPAADCRCRKSGAIPETDGWVRLLRETKGRKGKGVTLITGIALEAQALKQLAKALKQKCGSGGSLKDGVIEIQGDHRDILEKELCRLGYNVKRSGG